MQAGFVEYPSWWSGATTVAVVCSLGTFTGLSRSTVEFLPQGIAFTPNSGGDSGVNVFVPWATVTRIEQNS
jgi:hypothetical protein